MTGLRNGAGYRVVDTAGLAEAVVAFRRPGESQEAAAARLGILQPYFSKLERGRAGSALGAGIAVRLWEGLGAEDRKGLERSLLSADAARDLWLYADRLGWEAEKYGINIFSGHESLFQPGQPMPRYRFALPPSAPEWEHRRVRGCKQFWDWMEQARGCRWNALSSKFMKTCVLYLDPGECHIRSVLGMQRIVYNLLAEESWGGVDPFTMHGRETLNEYLEAAFAAETVLVKRESMREVAEGLSAGAWPWKTGHGAEKPPKRRKAGAR